MTARRRVPFPSSRGAPARAVRLAAIAALCLPTLAVLAVLGAPPATAASPVEPVPGVNGVGAVACPTATGCVAVAGLTNPITGYETPAVVPITDGNPGPAQVLSRLPSSAGLHAIACETATTCIAVGGMDANGLVVPIVNGVAGTPVKVKSGYLAGVACTSSTACVAVGFKQRNRTTFSQPIVLPITNGVPGGVTVVKAADSTTIAGIACVSATDCVTVGQADIPEGQNVFAPAG